MWFVDKQNKSGNGFCGELYPYARVGKIVGATGLAIPNVDGNMLYSLKFATEQRANEVFETLNKPSPKNNMDIFRKAIETIKILEESDNYMEADSLEDKKQVFFDKFLKFLGIKNKKGE